MVTVDAHTATSTALVTSACDGPRVMLTA